MQHTFKFRNIETRRKREKRTKKREKGRIRGNEVFANSSSHARETHSRSLKHELFSLLWNRKSRVLKGDKEREREKERRERT
jgi:hypothetical protein